jgi:ribosomal protein S20
MINLFNKKQLDENKLKKIEKNKKRISLMRTRIKKFKRAEADAVIRLDDLRSTQEQILNEINKLLLENKKLEGDK